MRPQMTVAGNVGQEPETKLTKNGAQMLKFSIAANRTYNGEKLTTWFNVTVFGKDGEFWADKLHKGDRVLVIGDYEFSEFIGNDGQKKFSHGVFAKAIENFSSREDQPRAAATASDDLDDLPF